MGASLPDGVYDLTVNAVSVTDVLGQILTGGNRIYTFHRLYGDFDGNKTVNAADYFQFKKSLGLSSGTTGFNSLFDYDANGTVNAADYFQFKKRLGTSLSY